VRNDLDRAEHRHTIKDGGTGTLTNREASFVPATMHSLQCMQRVWTERTRSFPTATLNKSVVEESVEGESVLAKLDVLADLLRLLGNHLGLFLGFLLDVLGCLGRGLLGFLSLARS
jgi:hypothetical protein